MPHNQSASVRGYIEDVTKHVATCSACQKGAQSSDALTVIGEKDREGLAYIFWLQIQRM